jgi:hypothetical protein
LSNEHVSGRKERARWLARFSSGDDEPRVLSESVG